MPNAKIELFEVERLCKPDLDVSQLTLTSEVDRSESVYTQKYVAAICHGSVWRFPRPLWLNLIRADCAGPASRTISLGIRPATRGSCSPAANSARAALVRGAAGVGLGAGADDPCRPRFRIAADRIQRQGTRAIRPLGLIPRMEPRVLRGFDLTWTDMTNPPH